MLYRVHYRSMMDKPSYPPTLTRLLLYLYDIRSRSLSYNHYTMHRGLCQSLGSSGAETFAPAIRDWKLVTLDPNKFVYFENYKLGDARTSGKEKWAVSEILYGNMHFPGVSTIDDAGVNQDPMVPKRARSSCDHCPKSGLEIQTHICLDVSESMRIYA